MRPLIGGCGIEVSVRFQAGASFFWQIKNGNSTIFCTVAVLIIL